LIKALSWNAAFLFAVAGLAAVKNKMFLALLFAKEVGL